METKGVVKSHGVSKVSSKPPQTAQIGTNQAWRGTNRAAEGSREAYATVSSIWLTPDQSPFNRTTFRKGITCAVALFATGTTFHGSVSDLWDTRTMSFTMAFSGLSTGVTYRVWTWHNKCD